MCVIDMEEKAVMRATCLKETANLGVNIIIDQRTSFQVQVTVLFFQNGIHCTFV